MSLSILWFIMLAVSVLYGAAAGRAPALGDAVTEGVSSAVRFCLGTGGLLCLWSGVMELLRRSGVTDRLARLLHPMLCRLFPLASEDEETLQALSANVSANLLGLGNAATPMGIRAAEGMARLGEASGAELCHLVVLNTASIQLLPTTVAAVRAACGCGTPFDILPCVWLTSLCSVTAGLLCERLLARFVGRKRRR